MTYSVSSFPGAGTDQRPLWKKKKTEPKVMSTSHDSNKNKFHTTQGREGAVCLYNVSICSNCTLRVPHLSSLGASHAPYWRKQVRLRGKEQQKLPFSSNFTAGEPKRQRAQSSALIRKTALPSLEIASCTFLDSVSKTTARGSFSWSEEKGLARLKRSDFGGMQDSSPGLRPGGGDVTASAGEAWGWGGRGEPAPGLQLPRERSHPTSGEVSA